MESRDDSDEVRSAFGILLKNKAKSGGKAFAMPAGLAGISIAISHTFTTRVRVRILREMAKLHRDANPELSPYVTNFLPRPCLKVRHPGGKVDTHLYVDAIKRFGHYLSSAFLAQESLYAKGVGLEHLQSLFLVLSPDHIQAALPISPDGAPAAGSKRGSDHLDEDVPAAKKGAPSKSQASKNKGKGKKSVSINPVTTSNSFAALAALAEATPPPASLNKSYLADSEQGSASEEGDRTITDNPEETMLE